MKKIICLVLLVTIMGNLSAQKDTNAKTILDQISAKNKNYQTLRAEFLFSMDNPLEDIHERSEGEIIVKGDKYRLNLMGIETYFDGTNIYSYLKDAEEVTISLPDEEEKEALNPAKMFSIYERGFTYKYINETQENGKRLHIIDLLPSEEDKAFSHIRLKIDKQQMQIYSLTSFGKDGNNITIKLKHLTPNINLSENDFVFDPKSHPGVEINDMR